MADKTNGETYEYSGINGRSQYSDINGTRFQRNGLSILSRLWKQWYATCGEVDKKPGAAFRSPVASWGTSMTFFYSENYQWLPAKPVGY